MLMLLALDMGNTNITLGVFRGDNLVMEARVATDRAKTEDQYAVDMLHILRLYGVDHAEFDGAVISSVVPSLDRAVSEAVSRITSCEPLFIVPGIKTGLDIRIDNPAQLGADLLVGAVAAMTVYGAPCVVWDLGTATTVSAIDAFGAFRGGAIMPGVGTSFNSLVSSASLLPHIRLEAPKQVIGTNTIACMQSGAVYGNVSMIDGMTERILAELGIDRATVVITGGFGRELASYCQRKPVYDSHLLLKGLRILYEKNR